MYILLGTNSMATLTDEAFLKYYNDFLDFLLPQLPQDTVYYIQGIPPVSAEKMAGDENFSVERIRGLNENLAKIAYDRDLHYLDLFSALADENGALRADIASGSIHLNNEGYNVWREFLVTHTAYSKENPYLPGSPYYTAPAA
ncbi:MAG: GDSL-type esterase/lipase family protein [Ruthenibacterium lactatiformans]